MTITETTPVRITDTRCRYYGYVGTVAEVNPAQHYPYGVAGLEDWLLWFGDADLVVVADEAVVGA